MYITFLGTDGNEGYPGIFCKCEDCINARNKSGKNIRSRSSVLINDDLLIDLPPDIYMHTITYNFSLADIKLLLITHSHEDHFYPEELRLRRPPYALQSLDKLVLISNEMVNKKLLKILGDPFRQLNIETIIVELFKKYQVFDYTVIPIKAIHTDPEITLNYIISKKQQVILCVLETGPYPEETLSYLTSFRFDAIIIEAIMGYEESIVHQNFKTVETFRNWSRDQGILKNDGKFIITNFSHGRCPTHDKIEQAFKDKPVIVAYDGMRVKI